MVMTTKEDVSDEASPLISKSPQKQGGMLTDTRWPLQSLIDDFGGKFLVFICCAQHVSKGFVGGFIGSASSYIYKAYKVPAPQVSTYAGVTSLPWALKPVIGVLSDCFPIFGYARLPYFATSATIGVASLLTLGIMRENLKVEIFVMLLFCNALYISCTDLLSEAVYARELRNNPTRGPSLLALIWGGMTVAGMLATLLSGFMLSHGSPWNLYSIACVPAAIVLIPVSLNWQGECWLPPEEVQKRRERLWQQKESLALAAILTFCTLLLTWGGLSLTAEQNGVVSLVCLVVLLFSFSVLLNPTIAGVNAFSLIQGSLTLSTGGAGFYFFMDSPVAFPDGPHFSIPFYNIVLPLTGSLCSLIGIYIYSRYAGVWTYQRMYVIGNLVGSCLSLLDIIFFSRLNKRWGINDHVFVLGSSALESVVWEWTWMPSVVLLSQLCPRGMEAIMYANLAGCSNIGRTISSNFTANLLKGFNVTPNGSDNEAEAFRHMWCVSLVATMLPLIPVVLVPWFIPNKLNNERVFDRDDVAVNEGSLFRRWCGYNERPNSAGAAAVA